MPWSGREPLPRRRSNPELLEDIYLQGGLRRRRRRRAAGLGALTAALGVLAGSAVVADLPRGSSPQQVAARAAAGATSGADSGSATHPPMTTGPAPATSSETRSRPPATRPSGGTGGRVEAAVSPEPPATEPAPSASLGTAVVTTTVAPPPPCRDSTDPACGPFRWDPDPGANAPLTITVTARPRAGEPRTFDFHVVYADADAQVRADCRFADFGDGGTLAASPCAMAACLATYGPTPPPAPQPGRAEATVSHTFAAAGTYTVSFWAQSGSPCADPYASYGTGTVEVSVP